MDSDKVYRSVIENAQEDISQLQSEKAMECFSKNQNSLEDYTNCLNSFSKLAEDEQKRMTPLIIYSQLKANKCIESGSEAGKCWADAAELIKERVMISLRNLQ